MVDNKIDGLPVMRDGRVVGLITETDLFKVLLELMGVREGGVRVTALMPERFGELATLAKAVTDARTISSPSGSLPVKIRLTSFEIYLQVTHKATNRPPLSASVPSP